MRNFHTIPEMLLNCAANYENARALNDKAAEGWQSVSMQETTTRVRRLAAALNTRLPTLGTSVGILAAPSSNWLVADIAIMLSGGVSIPFFVDFSEAHFLHKVEDSEMKTIFVFGDVLWKRFLPLADRFDLVITDQSIGKLSNAVHVGELYASGKNRLEIELDLIQDLLKRIDEHDLAAIIYTSGSTGMPKGVELTHRNLVAQLRDINGLFPVLPCEDKALSLLPVAHTLERTIIYLYLMEGLCIYFVDRVENVGSMMREIQPSMMTVVPRLLEKVHARIGEKASGIPGLKGRFARWTFRRANRPYIKDEPFSLLNWIADRIMGWQVGNAFGGALKALVAGGTHMPDELNHFFIRMGIPVYEGYGLTEASPVICTNYPGHRKVGTVGHRLASVEIKISTEGEVWARGPNIMRGYHHRPEETTRVIDSDGWLHTGDIGTIDQDGYLTIVARQKELFKTSTGEIVFPGPLENALCHSVLVDMACIIAEACKFTSCLLFLSEIATEMDPRVLKQTIEELIQQVNVDLDHWEKIHGYALLTQLPSIENGELTPTFKLRRQEVATHYTDLIKRIYDETNPLEDFNEFTIGHC